jgi:hypothetical protein
MTEIHTGQGLIRGGGFVAGALALLLLGSGCRSESARGSAVADGGGEADSTVQARFDNAAEHGRRAHEGFRRAHRYLQAWLAQADSASGLIPRNLGEDSTYWNAKDAAADNYPFMVLTAAMTDRARFRGRLREMLRTETRLTSRLGPLPDTYSFSKDAFYDDEPDTSRIIFGASEYAKDGLLPLTEWLGPSPWSERMISLLDGIWKRAPVETPHGRIPSESYEINGEMLQVLARVYWMTGQEKYLDYALRLGDYYLLGDGPHPTRDTSRLRLRDHGGEIVNGLTELYATMRFARPEKRAAYRAPLHAMLGRILEIGRGPHGLFYNEINPQSGAVLDSTRADTYGYILDGYYTAYMIDSTAAYRQAVRTALEALDTHYRGYVWEGGSADGDADAIESALNLYNREPVPSAARWIDRQIQVMWRKQEARPDDAQGRWEGSGIIEGWHGDGNFARTSLMYSLWKTQGLTARPWRPGVTFGAVREGDRLFVSLSAEEDWRGRLLFDTPRHRRFLNLPLDWTRINQFPEWFVVEEGRRYVVRDLSSGGREKAYPAAALRQGLRVQLRAGEQRRLVVEPERAGAQH